MITAPVQLAMQQDAAASAPLHASYFFDHNLLIAHLLRAVALHSRLHCLKLHKAADVARTAQQLHLLEALQVHCDKVTCYLMLFGTQQNAGSISDHVMHQYPRPLLEQAKQKCPGVLR
jgi:hypothetical protein